MGPGILPIYPPNPGLIRTRRSQTTDGGGGRSGFTKIFETLVSKGGYSSIYFFLKCCEKWLQEPFLYSIFVV